MVDDELALLLIEDSEDDARIMAHELRAAGFAPRYERVSDEAGLRQALHGHRWDVVICDHSMPRFDAPKALRVLRQADLDVPFVVVSGRIGEATVVSLMKSGASDYLHKDDLHELATVVRRVLDEARVASERKRARQGMELLAGASSALARSLDIEHVVDEAARLVIRHLADACVIEVASSDGRTSAHGVAHVVPAVEDAMRARRRRRSITTARFSGDPQVVTAIDVEVQEALGLTPADNETAAHIACALFVPFGSHDRIAGTIGMARSESRPRFDDMDLRIATELAARLAAALDNVALLREAQLARADAETANQLKDDFLAITAHELRTPMTSILGYARLLLEGKVPPEKRQRALEVIDRNAATLARIVDDLVDYSRISSGRLQLQSKPVRLSRVAEAAITAIRPAADAKQIRLDARIVDGAGTTLGDPMRLEQVVGNLLGNAIRFTPRGGRVEIAVDRRGECVELQVSDTGDGIDPEFLPFVFDRFRQGATGPSRSHNGLGLGLAIVKQLVELHGGRVEARSEGLGRGATFWVRLPALAEPVNTAGGELPTRDVSVRDLRACSPEVAGLRILVVDDDENTRTLLDGILCLHGVDVVVAASVAEAIDVFAVGPPNVLVSDLSMPGETGYDLVRRVRRLQPARGGRVPAIALSAFARDEDRAAALDAGFDRFLAKPVDPQELVVVIAEVASGARRIVEAT